MEIFLCSHITMRRGQQERGLLTYICNQLLIIVYTGRGGQFRKCPAVTMTTVPLRYCRSWNLSMATCIETHSLCTHRMFYTDHKNILTSAFHRYIHTQRVESVRPYVYAYLCVYVCLFCFVCLSTNVTFSNDNVLRITSNGI